jgi:hypothetical protein
LLPTVSSNEYTEAYKENSPENLRVVGRYRPILSKGAGGRSRKNRREGEKCRKKEKTRKVESRRGKCKSKAENSGKNARGYFCKVRMGKHHFPGKGEGGL